MISQDAERLELLDHITRCRDLLAILHEPGARKTIEDIIVHLAVELKAIDARLADRI